jgi:hypothetical protein
MKHTITDLNEPNKPVLFTNFILGNYCFETDLGNFTVETSSFTEIDMQYEILHYTKIVETNYAIIESNKNDLDVNIDLWILHFDVSKSLEGARASRILNDPK